MKLVRLRADAFGVLRGEWRFDDARLNLVVDENERGKTSLLHAVVAALYGLDDRRSDGAMSAIERWRPWDGGPYTVELEMESDGDAYTIRRDFAAGTLEVTDAHGHDVTAEFGAGRDDVPVGRALLGLDADEFTKCAFWKQGELADVVPEQEKDRRASTLQARLESAADTRAGDTSAVEALQAIDDALRAFESPELGATLPVDHALKRLEALRDTITVDLRSLEHDHGVALGTLERIATLDDEERTLRTRLRALEAHAAAVRATAAAQRLERDDRRRAAIATLHAEAESLAGAAGVPADAEAVLSGHAARHAELVARAAAATERRREFEPALATTESAIAGLGAFAGRGAADADALAAQALELARLDDEIAGTRHELDAATESMHVLGLDPARLDTLLPRFDGLSPEHAELLREQAHVGLQLQTDTATAEQARSMGRTMLRDIRRWQRPRVLVGVTAGVLGLAAVVAGYLPEPLLPNVPLAAAGAGALGAGLVVVIATSLSRRRAREEATARVVEADDLVRRTQLRTIENDRQLVAAAIALGFANAAQLLEGWDEAQRLRDAGMPVRTARERLAALERRRETLVGIVRPLLPAGTALVAATLDDAASRIRRRLALEQGRDELGRRLAAIEAEARDAAAAAAECEHEAIDAIASAGLTYEPGASFSAWIAEVAAQVRRMQRLRMVVDGELPALEAERLDEPTRAALAADVERARTAYADVGDAERDAVGRDVPATDGELHAAQARVRLDALRDERERLRGALRAVSARFHAEQPGLLARLDAVEGERGRAERFRDAALLARTTIERVARETHRTWAEFLNQRVTGLLHDVGSSIGKVRFGDDLDFAVTLGRDRQAARGKAVHQLSSGARDQLHIGVRLAISEYLSRGGESLPLLIDDCFATSDDDRTRQGMKLLLELSRTHQLLFVTCHRARYETLAAGDRSLWDDRVHWLELRPGVQAGA